MVKKIKKKITKGPKGLYAVPLAIVMTALFGFECSGRDFRRPFEDITKLREALRLQLHQVVLPADRVLSDHEYSDWSLKSSPGRLAEIFSRSGVIPMGPAIEEEEGDSGPRLGILPMIAVVKGAELETLGEGIGRDWSEVARTAFQNSVYPTFNLIAGYDRLLYLPPRHARDINRSITAINDWMEDTFRQAGRCYPGPFDPLPQEILSGIPIQEVVSKIK